MNEPDPRGFVRSLRGAIARAATRAREIEGSATNAPKGHEETPEKQALTQADLECQEILLTALLESQPGVRIEAEEDTPTCRLFDGSRSESVVVIDPIDGTLHSFLQGEGPYAILLGLVVEGVYRAGLVALPREGLFFSGATGGGATWNRARGDERPARLQARGNRVLVSHGMPDSVCVELRARGFEVVFGCGGAVSVAPLIPGIRAGARYAAGDGGVSPRGRIGVVISREAGAIVIGADGQPFPHDMDTPAKTLLIAGNPEDSASLRAAFAAAGCG